MTDEDLPALMTEANSMEFTLLDGSKVTIKPQYGASIKVDNRPRRLNGLGSMGMTTLKKQYLVSLDAEKTILHLRSRRLLKKKATFQARLKRSNPCHYGLLSKNVLRMGTSSQWSYLGRMLVKEPLLLKRKEQRMAEASKAVAEKKATEVAAFDFAQLQKDAGKGNENVGKDDLALPFIKILFWG